jgi:hypothetical protein
LFNEQEIAEIKKKFGLIRDDLTSMVAKLNRMDAWNNDDLAMVILDLAVLVRGLLNAIEGVEEGG